MGFDWFPNYSAKEVLIVAHDQVSYNGMFIAAQDGFLPPSYRQVDANSYAFNKNCTNWCLQFLNSSGRTYTTF